MPALYLILYYLYFPLINMTLFLKTNKFSWQKAAHNAPDFEKWTTWQWKNGKNTKICHFSLCHFVQFNP